MSLVEGGGLRQGGITAQLIPVADENICVLNKTLTPQFATALLGLNGLFGQGCTITIPNECSGLQGTDRLICRMENIRPSPDVYPDPASLDEEQIRIRQDIASRYGVGIADGECGKMGHLHTIELKRFQTILDGYDRLGLVRGKLSVIQVGSAPESYTYGGRPVSYAGYQKIRFYCVTSGHLPDGFVEPDVFGLMTYFSHEMGHVLTLDANSGLKKQDELLGYYDRAKPGHLQPDYSLEGDFISEYAQTDAGENQAENFSEATYTRYPLPGNGFEKTMVSVFQNSPLLSVEILSNFEFAATDTEARVLVWMTPDGGVYDYGDYDGDGEELTLAPFSLPVTWTGDGKIETVQLPSGPVFRRPDDF